MIKDKASTAIEMVSVDKINVLNPRVRNKKTFGDITNNITFVGLKKPITITRNNKSKGKIYDLVCGQGRLEAFIATNQSEIPAIVIDASEEQALIMSLVENLARSQYRSVDLLKGIEILRNQGYNTKAIGEKTGHTTQYIIDVLNMIDKGEERLLTAVEQGQIPITLAIQIATSPGNEQAVLQEAYETKQLRGNRLLLAKKLLESRKREGKTLRSSRGSGISSGNMSVKDVLRVYQKEVDRKKLITKKAGVASDHILFVVEAMRRLLREENFVNLLRAENMVKLPKQLSALMESGK